jgi:cold shock CspA family protein
MRYQGKINGWKDDQGFGFVTPNGGGERTFVHIKSFSDRSRRPVDGDMITYEAVRDEKNRLKAEQVRFVKSQSSQPTSSTGNLPRILFAVTLVLPPVFPCFGSGVTSPAVALVAACSLACSPLWWRFAGQWFSCLRGCVGQPGCGRRFGGVAAPAACVQWAPGSVVCHCPWPGQAVGSNSALHRTACGSR